MTKHWVFLLLLSLTGTLLLAQPLSTKLNFAEGKKLDIQMDIKATVVQQAGGQTIDFTADATALHFYKTTHSTAENTTLHHQIKTIRFHFDGMGQKRSFDSDNAKDMEGIFGTTAKEIVSRKFDLVIDPSGKTLMVKPEKMDSVKADERLAIVFTMLKDITHVVYPPKKGQASFFKILPDKEISKGDTWVESFTNENGKFNTTYTLSDITDSTFTIDFKGNSNTVNKATMMGMETSTTMNNTYTGIILVDRATGIIKEKTTVTESNGNTEAMGGSVPVTSKTTVIIRVTPEP